jgi:hypothetical protein
MPWPIRERSSLGSPSILVLCEGSLNSKIALTWHKIHGNIGTKCQQCAVISTIRIQSGRFVVWIADKARTMNWQIRIVIGFILKMSLCWIACEYICVWSDDHQDQKWCNCPSTILTMQRYHEFRRFQDDNMRQIERQDICWSFLRSESPLTNSYWSHATFIVLWWLHIPPSSHRFANSDSESISSLLYRVRGTTCDKLLLSNFSSSEFRLLRNHWDFSDHHRTIWILRMKSDATDRSLNSQQFRRSNENSLSVVESLLNTGTSWEVPGASLSNSNTSLFWIDINTCRASWKNRLLYCGYPRTTVRFSYHLIWEIIVNLTDCFSIFAQPLKM